MRRPVPLPQWPIVNRARCSIQISLVSKTNRGNWNGWPSRSVYGARPARSRKRWWRRWQSWALPTMIGVIGTIASLLSAALYFWDLKPFLERKLWPPPPNEVPNVVVRITNPEKTAVSLYSRGALVLWLPDAMYAGTPRVGGKYEIVASDAGLVHDAMAPVRAGGDTKILVKVMDRERRHQYLKRGERTTALHRRSHQEIPCSRDHGQAMRSSGYPTCPSACSRSSIISSTASIPTDNRTRLSRMPMRSRWRGDISRCELIAG